MKLTNLDYVQNILSSLGSDEVNSVADTVESRQVLEIVKTCYFNIISRAELPEHTQLIQLDPSLSLDTPVMMYVPAGVNKIHWLQYFNNNINSDATSGGHDINVDITSTTGDATTVPGYYYVNILPMKAFLDMTTGFNPSETDVESFTFTDSKAGFPGNYTFYYKNDKTPQFCTVINDYYVIFDSYDSAVDDTLQSSKTMAEGMVTPAWQGTDEFIPNIDERQVPLLLNEAKSLAYFELKQSAHPKAEQEAKRQWGSLQKNKATVDRPTDFEQLPNFGRPGMMYASFFKRMGWDR